MTCRAAERIQGKYKKWGPYYKEVWETVVVELLECERDPENASNRYAVAVKKELS